jgi:hypothetical protein
MPNAVTRAEDKLTDGHKIILGIIVLVIVIVFLHGLFGKKPAGNQPSGVNLSAPMNSWQRYFPSYVTKVVQPDYETRGPVAS